MKRKRKTIEIPGFEGSVERIETDGGGSYIEPPFNKDWSEWDRVQWTRAVAEVDSGLTIHVSHQPQKAALPIYYSVSTRNRVAGIYTYHQVHTYLNGFVHGANAFREGER